MGIDILMTCASILFATCSVCNGRISVLTHHSAKAQNDASSVSTNLAVWEKSAATGKAEAQDLFQKKYFWLLHDAKAKSEEANPFKNLYFQQFELENEVCPQLDVPQNGQVLLSDSYNVGSIALYSCNNGYVLAGSMASVCQISLEWSEEQPLCEEVTCTLLEDPANGTVILSSVTVGSVANFTCDPGFGLIGETEIYCLESGEWNGTEPNCTENLWPKGSYGFPAPSEGCPRGLSLGCRFHDNEDVNNKNLFSNEHLLKGSFGSDINICYCVTEESIQSDIDWPPGRYCINRKDDTCPDHFTSGFIFFDDEDDINKNSEYGNMPDGFYDKDTRMFYCCRDDGNIEDEIVLPTSDDFVLYQYSKQGCQLVAGMLSTEVVLLFDDEDWFNSDSCEDGPYNPGCSEDHVIFMCHYTAEK